MQCRHLIDTDWDNMEFKQLLTVQFLMDECNQFIMFTRLLMNNNLILMHLAQCNIRLIITPHMV
jgi:hypothetical protein